MIYKINTNIDTLDKSIDEFKKIGNFCMCKDVFYLETDVDIDKVNYINNYIILTFDNYKKYTNYSKHIEKWCYEKLCEEELKEFEKSEDCQNKLKALNQYMDVLEKEMGVGSGVKQTSKATKSSKVATKPSTHTTKQSK